MDTLMDMSIQMKDKDNKVNITTNGMNIRDSIFIFLIISVTFIYVFTKLYNNKEKENKIKNKEVIKIIKKIDNIMDKGLNIYYTKSKNISIKNRYIGLEKYFQKILALIRKNYIIEANKYYKKRSIIDKKLENIQNFAINEVQEKLMKLKLEDYEILPAGSFTAKTNLIDESDIDIIILIKKKAYDNINLIISNILGSCGYNFLGIRNSNIEKNYNKHYVFNKFISNVEIEYKIMIKENFEDFISMHKYLDTKMDMSDKIMTTYIKYILKNNNVNIYNKFKQIYYCQAGHKDCNKLLYPLK